MKKYNIVHIITTATKAVALAFVALLHPSQDVCAQSTTSPSVCFTTADTSACDISGSLPLKIRLKNIPETYTSIEVYVCDNDNPTEKIRSGELYLRNYSNNILEFDISNPNYHYNQQTGHAEFSFSITDVFISATTIESDGRSIDIEGPSTLTWHIYGTPSTDATLVSTTDPSCIKIMNDSEYCGYDVTLKANDAWSAVSTYTWESSNDIFTIDPSGTTSELSQTRFLEDKGAAQAMKTTVTLTQTVGGLCTSTTSKEITLLGNPDATLSADDAYGDGTITICSSVSEEDDPGRYFNGTLTIYGEAPFSATLSTGDTFTGLTKGTNTFENAYVSEGGYVTIASVTDVNGCTAPDSQMSGYFTVLDRKPQPLFRNDTLQSQSKDLSVEVEPTDMSDAFEWGVMPEYESFDTEITGNTYNASIKSNMNSTISYYVIETDENGVACSSDTTVLTVNFDMALRYPNAISPNGDGRNDYLVIEGLPEKNSVMVVDKRGKKVFEATDYRNDWAADGVDDGYYVYVFKGQGTKTVKETLVIKRTND